MMLFDGGIEGTAGAVALFHLFGQSPSNYTLLAQQDNIDLWANVQKVWNNLIETGQLWALLIGAGVGWWIRSILP